MAGKDQQADDTELAEQVGEQNTPWFSFGPANVRALLLSTAVELGDGTGPT